MIKAHTNKNSANVLLKSAVSPSESTRLRNPRLFSWAALIAGILFAARYFGSGPLRELLQWISGFGSTAPLVFIPLYVVACVLFIPGSILTLSAGFFSGVSFQPAELRLRPDQRRSVRLRSRLMGRDTPRHDPLRLSGLARRRSDARRHRPGGTHPG